MVVGYKIFTTMKMLNFKYTVLFAAFALLCAACNNEKEPTFPSQNFVVENVNITTTERSAEVTMSMPYYAVNGVKVEGTTPSVEYRLDPSKEDTKKFDWSVCAEYQSVDGGISFTINELTPGSHYELRVALDAGEHGTQISEVYNFKTTDAAYIFIPKAQFSAFGYYAHCALSDAELFIDNTKISFNKFRLEYGIVGSDEVATEIYDCSDMRSGSFSFSIPATTGSHLEPESKYECRIFALVNDTEYEAYDSFNFTTNKADVDILFGYMQARIGGGEVIATLAESIVKIDSYYTATEQDMAILYRVHGSEEWSSVIVTETDQKGKIEARIDLDELLPTTTYDICASISIYGVEEHSNIVQVTTPESDNIIVPVPPVGGDTSMMAGTWHLIEWRGAEPSFDIYMVITETGGITLWQRLEDCTWELYQSAAETADGVISGTYTDGVAWGADYYYSVSGDQMTWTDTEDSDDVSVYERSTLPSELAELEHESASTRSMGQRFL